MRAEAEVFSDLGDLCRSAGYVHALAYLCFRDSIVRYSGDMRAKDMLPMYSTDHLIRTEMSTLIGLMIQGEMNWTKPSPEVIQQQIDHTEALLRELHETFLPPMGEILAQRVSSPGSSVDLLGRGDFVREAIFYGGESAYSFQYRDIAPLKYGADDGWLKTNKGFSIAEARDIAEVIARLQERKLMATVKQMKSLPPEQWTFLPGYSFSARETADASGLPESIVGSVLGALALPSSEKNEEFRAVDDFNVVNATPLLKIGDDFVSFQAYSLVEALYDSPFYWMAADKAYAPTAMQNRGRFTEAFCRERLALVFGKERVHTNVDIYESKAKRVGEIDVLALFGDRAVIVQAKSKRLTLDARKGNDGRIREDFQKSVQDSYDQGRLCAQRLTDPKVTLVNPEGRQITVPNRVKEIYILCVVSDHYPSLQFQARQFLTYHQTDVIQPPLVLDVFALDAITEMLPSPLRFLSYVNRRVGYTEQLLASHETVILSYHLRHNLWVKNDVHMLMLGDDLSADLDVAMAVRRDGVIGSRTPDGILTRGASTAIGRFVASIEARPVPGVIDFGFLLLALSLNTINDASRGIERIAQLARRDRQTHDLTVGIGAAKSGFTVHCSELSVSLHDCARS